VKNFSFLNFSNTSTETCTGKKNILEFKEETAIDIDWKLVRTKLLNEKAAFCRRKEQLEKDLIN